VVPAQSAGLSPNPTVGIALCTFIERFGDETRQIDLRLVDRAGHQSNVISALADIEGRRPRR
jgi:hypothetical protein